MPVDRAARNRLASALAAYLRGEVDNFALDDARPAATDDAAATQIGTGLWFIYDDLKCHRVSLTRDQWALASRTIAFLRTDLPLPPFRDVNAQRRQRMLGYAGLGCIIASIALACFTSRVGWLLLPGAVVGVPTTLWAILRNCDDDANNPSPFYPFEDESTWTRHEHLLEGERLPPYNPGLHAQPIRGPVSRAGMNVVCVPGTIIWALFMAPLFAALLLLRGRGDLRHRS